MHLTFPFLQHINELTMKLSVEDVLTRAEALYRQLMACPVSPGAPCPVNPMAPPTPPSSSFTSSGSTPTHH